MNGDALFLRYRDLQRYVGWTGEDVARVAEAGRLIAPHIDELIDDFYQEIARHEETARVITGGAPQIARLKTLLRRWIEQLFSGPYDRQYVAQRWQVGRRHVEIGLAQIYVSAALARLRRGMLDCLGSKCSGDVRRLLDLVQSLNRLLDLDLAIVEDSFQAEHVERRRRAERDRMRAALHEEREFSEGLLSKAQAVILVLDLQGRVVRFNPYLRELCGYRLEDVQGEDWVERFLPAEDWPRMREAFQQTIREGEISGVVTAILTRYGDRRRISWTHKRLKDAAGATFAVLAVGHDITELEEAQQRALQAQRLATIGQMAAALAHEGRNALQRIQANAETLELELEAQPDAIELVARIQRAGEDLRRLFDEIRGFAAPINLDRSTCSLAGVWREAWESLASQRKGRDVTLSENIGAMDLTCTIDRFRLVQVFRNLLENSLAACRDPVDIRIDCSPTGLDGRPAICVHVRDNGPGIAIPHRARVFEPFFSTKTKGIGLGMAIARRNVEAHGGTIIVGQPSNGAEIIVTLPKTPKS